MEIKELYKKNIEVNGIPKEVDKCIEECAELTDALEKVRYGRASVDQVVTEIADVFIMCEQMAIIFGQDKVQAQLDFKRKRLEEGLSGKKIGYFPFSLEHKSAVIHGEMLVTLRNGEAVTIYEFAADESDYPIVGKSEKDGLAVIMRWTADGRFILGIDNDPQDLVLHKVKKTE